jgi:hypothetical protein
MEVGEADDIRIDACENPAARRRAVRLTAASRHATVRLEITTMCDPIVRLGSAAAFLALFFGGGALAVADPITFAIHADATGIIVDPSGRTQPFSGPTTITFQGDTANVTETPSGAAIDSFSAVGFAFPNLPELFALDPDAYPLSNSFNARMLTVSSHVQFTYGPGALNAYAFQTDVLPSPLTYNPFSTASIQGGASADGTLNSPVFGFLIESFSNVTFSASLGSTSMARLSTGTVHGVGRGSTRAGIAMVGTFRLHRTVDLSAVPATLTITSLLHDGAADVAGLPLILIGDTRNTARTAYFKTAAGPFRAKATVHDRGRGEFTFRIEMSGATSEPSGQCPHTTLTTAFIIQDGVNAPVAVSAQQPWRCFGRNQYLRSLP